tara:strand:- start:30 stop:215 length:186 start_codon:yes stop_codon:yes gene_type:complete
MPHNKKFIHLPKLHNTMGASHNAYIKATLGQTHAQRPSDMVETLIQEKKKELMKKKGKKDA